MFFSFFEINMYDITIMNNIKPKDKKTKDIIVAHIHTKYNKKEKFTYKKKPEKENLLNKE